jgi:hypothetical protein
MAQSNHSAPSAPKLKENPMIDAPKLKYKVVSNGALPSAVRPRIERSIEQVLNADTFSSSNARFGRQVTTSKTKIG